MNETRLADDTPVALLSLWKPQFDALIRARLHTVGDIRRAESEIGLLAVRGVSFSVRRKILSLIGDDPKTSFSDEIQDHLKGE